MKNVFKTLGILCLIASAFFIMACPPGDEDFYTVTFAGAGINIPPQIVPENSTVKAPDAPVYIPAQGLYKDYAAPGFKTWYDSNNEVYDFSAPVTENITLTCVWNIPDTLLPTPIDITVDPDKDIVYTAIDIVNQSDGGAYTLILSDNVEAKKKANLTKGSLTIKIDIDKTDTDKTETDKTPPRTIIAPNDLIDDLYLLVGPKTLPATKIAGPTLTLDGIVLQGNGQPVSDSLIRVTYGATLIMEKGSKITGHINNTDADADKGNGSAVCIIGGNLIMNDGSAIEKNKSTSANNSKNNLVGGVYTYVPNKTNYPVTLTIEGGVIVDNLCGDKPADLYAAAGGTFTLTGKVRISALTLNADPVPPDTAATPPTIRAYEITEKTTVGKLSLRSTGTLEEVRTFWLGGQYILRGKLENDKPTDVKAADRAKFTLGEFKGDDNTELISEEYSINTNGKLSKKTD